MTRYVFTNESEHCQKPQSFDKIGGSPPGRLEDIPPDAKRLSTRERKHPASRRPEGSGSMPGLSMPGVPVPEVFQGKTVWQGNVEVFDLHGHPKAKRVYAWSHLDGPKDERTRFVAVLEIPPVVSAETAVRVQIVKDLKNQK